METIVRLAPLALLLNIQPAWADCEPRTVPVTPAAPVSRSELRVVLADPPADAPVSRSTVLTVNLEFQIAGYGEQDFKLFPTIKTGVNRSKMVTIDGRLLEVPVAAAAGKATLCVPLASFYDQEPESVSWPLELSFSVFRVEPDGSYVSVVTGRNLKLNTVDVPAAAMARQAEAPPAEYEDALTYVFDEFARKKAIYKACLQRFPALQPTLTPAYRAWESRHKADMEYVWTLQFEAVKKQLGGRGDIAMKGFDVREQMQQKSFAERPADALRKSCQRIVDEANPDDDPTSDIVGTHLDILRKWHAKK